MNLPRVPTEELEDKPALASFLVRMMEDAFRKTRTLSVTLTATSIAATTEYVASLTAKGLTTDDHIAVTKPTNTPDIQIVGSWVSATDTAKIKFYNISSGSVSLPSEVYKIASTRF